MRARLAAQAWSHYLFRLLREVFNHQTAAFWALRLRDIGCPREEWAKAELIQPSVQYPLGTGGLNATLRHEAVAPIPAAFFLARSFLPPRASFCAGP